jgi:hypothetical protein
MTRGSRERVEMNSRDFLDDAFGSGRVPLRKFLAEWSKGATFTVTSRRSPTGDRMFDIALIGRLPANHGRCIGIISLDADKGFLVVWTMFYAHDGYRGLETGCQPVKIAGAWLPQRITENRYSTWEDRGPVPDKVVTQITEVLSNLAVNQPLGPETFTTGAFHCPEGMLLASKPVGAADFEPRPYFWMHGAWVRP